MKTMERRHGEGRMEYLVRLGVIKSIGLGALTAAGAVLIPPAAPVLVAATVAEGIGGGAFAVAHQKLKNQRLNKGKRH